MSNNRQVQKNEPDWPMRTVVFVLLVGLVFTLLTGFSWDRLFTILGFATLCGIAVKLRLIRKDWENRQRRQHE